MVLTDVFGTSYRPKKNTMTFAMCEELAYYAEKGTLVLLEKNISEKQALKSAMIVVEYLDKINYPLKNLFFFGKEERLHAVIFDTKDKNEIQEFMKFWLSKNPKLFAEQKAKLLAKNKPNALKKLEKIGLSGLSLK